MITSIFSAEDARAIKCVPLSKVVREDCLVWRGEKTGQYSVRSGYKELMSRHENLEISDNIQSMYKRLWSLSLPSKMKIMVWRALQGFLPTGQTLYNRRIRNNATCVRCNAESETFLLVDRAESVWEKVVIAVWAIWWARNRQTMEGKVVTRHETISRILSLHVEIDVLKEKLPTIREVDIDRWKPPQNSWVKLNFDAVYKAQLNKSCSGFVIRNKKGEVMGSGITLHSKILDVGLAEAVACYQGLLFAKETSFVNVEVEGDVRVVIEKVIQGEDGRANLDSVIADIKAFKNYFHQISFKHVRREANQVAHIIAREGHSKSENTFWIEDIPAVARELVAAEETSNVL
ncbi:hypothetical protein Gotur_033172 [Gossypium turneri]